jgi:hypothetical protein
MSVLTLDRKLSDTTKSFVMRNFPDGPGMKIVTITPDDALDLLLLNEDNRPVSQTKVNQYAADIKAGRWTMNGETIKVARDGQLNDGQHRLEAVLIAGKPIETAMIYGVDRDTRLTVDQGRARGAGCYLGLQGVANSNAVAAIARMAVNFEASKGQSVSLGRAPTSAEILEFVSKHGDDLHKAVQFAYRMPSTARQLAPKTMFGFWAYIMRNTPEGLEYLNQVMTGTGITSTTSPAHRVRERLLGVSRSSKQTQTEIFLRGWTFHREGKPMTNVKITSGDLPKI